MPPASDNVKITKSMSQTAENIMTSKKNSDSSNWASNMHSGTDEEETHLKTTAQEKGQHKPLSNVEDRLNLHKIERSIMDAILDC